jgi:hypothetical protein
LNKLGSEALSVRIDQRKLAASTPFRGTALVRSTPGARRPGRKSPPRRRRRRRRANNHEPDREAALFALALEKPVEKRAAFLNAMGEGDAALPARLEARMADTETKP